MEDFEQKVLELLIKAKNDGIIIHGDEMIGYFFKGDGSVMYDKQLKELANENKMHWQELEFDFNELVVKSGINLTEYKRE